MANRNSGGISRRHLLATGAAVAGASMLPMAPIQAQAPARWRRYNVNSPEGQIMMGHYADAIKIMLKLPYSDPRNWYRVAFVHYVDCPHGNWWLLPWHRGITGWVERIVRKLSGFEQFAMPYWDWTANQAIPPIMSQGVLDPSNDAYIQKYENFRERLEPALKATDYFTPGSPRNHQLLSRHPGMTTSDILWTNFENAAQNGPTFFPWPQFPNVRNPDPNLDCVTKAAVAPDIISEAMASQDFVTFGSPAATQHSEFVAFGVLENYPHNNVHNNTGGTVYPDPGGVCDFNDPNPPNTGGFMQAFLSPTDPLFFLHHSNLDRLWYAWAAMNQSNPNVLPTGADFQAWASEYFLFFPDENGNYVTQNQAGFYRNTDLFNYDYQPGSVGTPAAAALKAVRARPPIRRFAAEIPPAAASTKLLSHASTAPTAVRLQPALLQATRGTASGLFAKVSVALPHHQRGQVFRVLVHTGDPAASVDAGTIRLFGHTQTNGAITAAIPIAGAIRRLNARGAIKPNGYLHFRVVAPAAARQHGAPAAAAASPGTVRDLRVQGVVVEAH